jgi:hypothetical protein
MLIWEIFLRKRFLAAKKILPPHTGERAELWEIPKTFIPADRLLALGFAI